MKLEDLEFFLILLVQVSLNKEMVKPGFRIRQNSPEDPDLLDPSEKVLRFKISMHEIYQQRL